MRLLTGLYLFLAFSFARAQTPADWWYFGNHAGLHFVNGVPIADTNGIMYALEGCATISNNQGNLLFYTNGTQVYDNTHNQMPNGNGLLGTASATHSAIAVPKPQSNNFYYIFTVDATENQGLNGLRYTLVDMNLNGGLGDVVIDTFNVQLFDSCTEKIVAYPHANAHDYWIVSHRLHDNLYRAYRLNETGVHPTPVTTSIGETLAVAGSTGNVPRGMMRFSPNGDKLATAIMSLNKVEVLDFNRTTGAFSNLINLYVFGKMVYGLEYSPNGQYLYVTTWSDINVYQFDMSLGSEAAIQASMDTIFSNQTGIRGALQVGLDKKIYVVKLFSPFLDVINNPNMPVSLCNYQDSVLYLEGRTNAYGLPTFVQSFLFAQQNAKGFCLGDTTQFSTDTLEVDSYFWDFGDPGSGSLNQSTDPFPRHFYADTGYYTVTLIVTRDTTSDTAVQEIYIYPRQTVDLGPDTIACIGDTVLFQAKQRFSSFQWNTGSTNDSIWITDDDSVYVTVFGICDTVSDTVLVMFDDPIVFNFIEDTTLCEGHTIILDADLQVRTDTFFWNTSDTIDSIGVTETGFYRFEASNACGTVADSVTITFTPVPSPTTLPPDTVNCFNNAIVLVRPDLINSSYVWSDSSTKKTYTIDTTETVWLAWFNECGFAVDTFKAIFNGEIKAELGEDTTICPTDSIKLNAHWEGSTYLWNTGDTTDSIFSELELTKLYVVTITNNLCSTIESRWVTMDDLVCPDINCALRYPNAITPNGDGLNDRFRAESDCEIYSYILTIWNRWGQLVSQTDNVAYGWDGYINGEPASSGVYYFRIDFKDRVVIDEDRNVYQGSFELIRE